VIAFSDTTRSGGAQTARCDDTKSDNQGEQQNLLHDGSAYRTWSGIRR
jgi:hypothetical protein